MPPGKVMVAASCASRTASCRLARLANVVMLPSGIIADAETIEFVPLLDVTVGDNTAEKASEVPDVPFIGHTVAIGTCTVVREDDTGNVTGDDASRA